MGTFFEKAEARSLPRALLISSRIYLTKFHRKVETSKSLTPADTQDERPRRKGPRSWGPHLLQTPTRGSAFLTTRDVSLAHAPGAPSCGVRIRGCCLGPEPSSVQPSESPVPALLPQSWQSLRGRGAAGAVCAPPRTVRPAGAVRSCKPEEPPSLHPLRTATPTERVLTQRAPPAADVGERNNESRPNVDIMESPELGGRGHVCTLNRRPSRRVGDGSGREA